jgi:biotin transport system substrate-specific component
MKDLLQITRNWFIAIRYNKVLNNIWVQAFCASWLIVVGAHIKIPFYPVPMTLHTFFIALLALVMPWPTAVNAVIFYLFYAAIGLPVSATGNNGIAAFLGPTAGFLWGFVLMSGSISWLMQRYQPKTTWFRLVFAFLGGCLLFGAGISYLAHLFGWQAAIKGGLLPFVFSEPTKYILAAYLSTLLSRFTKQ